ncbi:MAG: MOSC domain-containing protein [Gammaproteobacteria bacterium]
MAGKPLVSWLREWCQDELAGTLTAIYLADRAGAPMRRVEQTDALVGKGLAGDRYAEGGGHWRLVDAVQVTLVCEEDIVRAARRTGMALGNGEHRRNLVVRGIPLAAYRRRRFRIGDVLFEFQRPRPPCGYLDRVAGRGTAKALGRAAGIGARILDGGPIRVGDPVQVIAST